MNGRASSPDPVEILDLDTGERLAEVRLGPKETLRDALVRRRLPLRSVCGGSAICGTCWVDVLEGDPPPPAPDERELLARFAARGSAPRLACRLRPGASAPRRVALPR